MRSATCCALSPANATHLYLLYMTKKNYQTTAGRSVHTDRFQRKQEVLLSLTHGNQHCSAQSAFILIEVCTASWASLALCLFSLATR